MCNTLIFTHFRPGDIPAKNAKGERLLLFLGVIDILQRLCKFMCNTLIFTHFRPGGIPAKNSKGERLLLFLGVIDILQRYKLRKKFEHTLKSMVADAVSLLRPKHCVLYYPIVPIFYPKVSKNF